MAAARACLGAGARNKPPMSGGEHGLIVINDETAPCDSVTRVRPGHGWRIVITFADRRASDIRLRWAEASPRMSCAGFRSPSYRFTFRLRVNQYAWPRNSSCLRHSVYFAVLSIALNCLGFGAGITRHSVRAPRFGEGSLRG